MILELAGQIVKKYSNIKFHKNPSSESRGVPCGQMEGQTNRHDEANIRFPPILRMYLNTKYSSPKWHLNFRIDKN
jgi:hypothetical protein